jgi:hypothetical protein
MITLSMVSDWLRATLAAAAVLWLPGRAISEVLNRFDGRRPDLVTSVGLSVAGAPLAALFLSLARIRVNRMSLVGACILYGASVLVGCVDRLFLQRRRTGLWAGMLPHNWPARLGLLVLFAITLILRLIQIRNLVLPAWVDSLHHTHIVQVIREQGRIPDDLMSYTSIPFYYYFGFHVLVAAFGELADLPAPQAILIFGQVLNAVAILSIYQLAVELTHRRGVGIAAAMLTGFVSQMPAYYPSWGRYTLLTGIVLLPIAIAEAVKTWRNPNQPQLGLRLVLLTGGLILTHYLAAAFHFCFLLALVLTEVIGSRKPRWQYRGLALSAWSVLGLVIVAPWIIRVFPYVMPFVRIQTTVNIISSDPTDFLDRVGYLWYLVNRPRSWAILSLALPAAVVSLIYRRSTRILVVWLIILVPLFSEWPWQIQPFRADLILICLFLPMNILAAEGLLSLRQLLNMIMRFSLVPSFASILILITLSIWGFLDTISIINPVTVLATEADVEALTWIKENIPSNARFLVNVEHWQYGLYRGTDGGWWIPLLSHRATVLPPGVFYGWGNRRYVLEIREVAERVMGIDGCTPDFWEFVQEQHITHIYIGVKGGTLQPRWFDTCPGVRRVYTGYNVHIYEIGGVAETALP